MEERWSTDLMTRRQRTGETVEQYYNALNELWIRLEDENERYPENAKTHLFTNGLLPELSTAIAPFMSNTLDEAVERAKAFKSAFSRREPIAAYSATRQPAHSTSVETALT